MSEFKALLSRALAMSSFLAWWEQSGRGATKKAWTGLCVAIALAMGVRAFAKMANASHWRPQLGRPIQAEIISAVNRNHLEATWLLIAIIGLLLPRVVTNVTRFVRAWIAGLTSAIIPIAFLIVLLCSSVWAQQRLLVLLTLILGLILFVVAEIHLQTRAPRKQLFSELITTSAKGESKVSGLQWSAGTSDNPIKVWREDVLGRIPVVELLLTEIFLSRSPIIALQGGLGDGKTSVLNLLERELTGRTIVVPFKAWLPSSESSFASELFKNIAIECRRRFYIPQLQKNALIFARLVSEAVPHLIAIRTLIPTLTQREELEELNRQFARLPIPIVVLLDEIDRMQRDEIQVLFKILRGSTSIPNVTFVCAFSEIDLKRQLQADQLSANYLEKFFPMPVYLPPPSPVVISHCCQEEINRYFSENGWFVDKQAKDLFRNLLTTTWEDCFQPLCSNLRQAGRLIRSVTRAGQPISGEVNPFDLLGVEAIRLFFPTVYDSLRKCFVPLTDKAESQLSTEQPKSKALLAELDIRIEALQEQTSVKTLLSWMFPNYAQTSSDRSMRFRLASRREGTEKCRISESDYFHIYFRSALPEEMFSNTDLNSLVSALNNSTSIAAVSHVLGQFFQSLEKGSPKRLDFLWRFSTTVKRFAAPICEYLVLDLADRSTDLSYERFGGSEMHLVVKTVIGLAQRMPNDSEIQSLLTKAIARSLDDTFGILIIRRLENEDVNDPFVDRSKVVLPDLKNAFIERMRKKYQPGADIVLSQCDVQALRLWVENSDSDRTAEQQFWRVFIGQSRKRLAQVSDLIYGTGVWREDPTSFVDGFFPTLEIKFLMEKLPTNEVLDTTETSALERMTLLFQGKYSNISNLGGA
jgi:hypothetical protein